MIKTVRATGLERLELHRLRDRVGRLFAALQEATVADDPLASETWAPPVDLCETNEAIVLRVELPGLTADQIKVGATNTHSVREATAEVANGMLTIRLPKIEDRRGVEFKITVKDAIGDKASSKVEET